MPIHYTDLPAGHTEYSPPVTVSGMVITVGATSFRCCGDWELKEDQEFAVEPHAELDTCVQAVLAVHRETEEVVLLVDEVLRGDDTITDLAQTSYRPLCQLLRFTVPAGATSLDDVDIHITRRVKLEDR